MSEPMKIPMSSPIDFGNILSELGPRFAEVAEENGAKDRSVFENYNALRQSPVFSALVPDKFGEVPEGRLCLDRR